MNLTRLRIAAASWAGGRPAGAVDRIGAGHPLYDTIRVLYQQGNACLKPANCMVIEGDREVIREGAAAIATLRCPAATPYFSRAGTCGATSTSPSSCSTTTASR